MTPKTTDVEVDISIWPGNSLLTLVLLPIHASHMMLKVALLLHAQQHAKVQKNNGHHSKPQMSELYLQLMDNKLCSLKDQLKPPLWFMKTSSVTQREFTLNNHKNLLEDMPLKLLDGDLIKPVD